MADEPNRNPRAQPPNHDPALGEIFNPQTSLVESLGNTVDSIRQIAVDLGVRPYKVHAVRVKWSGGEIGRGTPETVLDQAIVPTPRIRNVTSVNRESTTAGTSEKGNIRLDRISPRYTEDEIKYYFSTQSDLGVDEEGFVEIYVDERDGQTQRKRYVVSRVPERRPDKFDWVVTLRKQEDNRQRDRDYRDKRDKVWR